MAEQLKVAFVAYLAGKGDEDLWARLKDHVAIDKVASNLPTGKRPVATGGNLESRQKSLLLAAKANCMVIAGCAGTWMDVLALQIGRLPAPLPPIAGFPAGTSNDEAVQVRTILADARLPQLIDGWTCLCNLSGAEDTPECPGCSAEGLPTGKGTVGWKVSPASALETTTAALLVWMRKGSPPGKKPVLCPPIHSCNVNHTHCVLNNCADCSHVRARY